MEIWLYKYSKLKEYYELYGHSNVPVRYKINDFNLGEWVSYQRKAYKKNLLNKKKITLLESLNFSWKINNNNKQTSIPEITIYIILKNLLEEEIFHRYNYKNNEFDIFIPNKNIAIEYDGIHWHSKESKKLKDLNKNEFCLKNGIILYRIREFGLEKISEKDFILDKSNNILLGLNYILNILNINKNIKISDYNKDIYNYQNLKNSWHKNYILLKEYINEYNEINIKTNHIYKKINLGEWIHNQRKLYKNNQLSNDKITLLKKLGISLNYNEDQWNKYYVEALKYFKTYGNLEIPFNYISNDLNLGTWISNQRHRYKNSSLSSDRINKLNDLGMRWNFIDKNYEKWINNYYLCKEYLQNNTSIKTNTIINNHNIYNWYKLQRKKYNNPIKYGTLTSEQIKLLKDINII